MFLKEKFETQTQCNATGKSNLPGIDISVSTADLKKESHFSLYLVYVSYWLSHWKALNVIFWWWWGTVF